jgi:hypothetical protein
VGFISAAAYPRAIFFLILEKLTSLHLKSTFPTSFRFDDARFRLPVGCGERSAPPG